MALADITLNDGQGTPVAHTFTFVRSKDNRTVRADMSVSDPEESLEMTHAHTEVVRAGKKVRTHLFRIDRTKLDSDGITPYSANIRLAADVPNAILSDALADDFAAFIRNWASSANVRAWLKGSVG